MAPRICASGICLLVAMALAATARPAAARDVTVTTDLETYPVGAVVEVSVHNAGPTDVEFNSSPFIAIVNLDTSTCLFGCLGLPVMTPLPADSTHVQCWDTGENPDAPGRHRVTAHIQDLVPPFEPPPSTEYMLIDPSPAEMRAWGGVKSLYR